MTDEWAFDQPPDCAVITLRQIADGSRPILHVSHDSDDHGWQFLTLDDAREEDAAVACLKNIVDLDASLLELADMPPGWHAWRSAPGEPWRREINPNDSVE